MPKRNAFHAQSGGVTAVINASACGVIQTARRHRARIGTVYAGRNGILGALDEDLVDTGRESAAAIGPKTVEALIVHFVDDLDAKVMAFQEFIGNSGGEESEWTLFHRFFERFLYKGKQT